MADSMASLAGVGVGNCTNVALLLQVLLNELVSREVPWDGYKPGDIKEKVTTGERPLIPPTMPHACTRLIERLWHKIASMRPTFAQMLPQLKDAQDALPLGSAYLSQLGAGGGVGGVDALDALDSLMR